MRMRSSVIGDDDGDGDGGVVAVGASEQDND